MRFEKWQALGNDYLIVEAGELPLELTPARVRRHLRPPPRRRLRRHPAALRRAPTRLTSRALRIFNPDGSEAELSGNGAREAIMYLRRRGQVDRDEFSILTVAGADPRHDHRADDVQRSRWAAQRRAPRTSRRGRRTGVGELEAGRAHVALPARRRSATRSARSRATELERARPRRDRPGDRTSPAVPEPHERVVVPRARAGRDPRPDLRARRRRDARRPGPAPAVPRSPMTSPAAAAPDRGGARRRRAEGRARRRTSA